MASIRLKTVLQTIGFRCHSTDDPFQQLDDLEAKSSALGSATLVDVGDHLHIEAAYCKHLKNICKVCPS